MFSKEFVVLYTHQKTKKHKTWQDGILKTDKGGNKAVLHDDQGTVLDSVFVHCDQVESGKELESDRYLISVEEEKHIATTAAVQVRQGNVVTQGLYAQQMPGWGSGQGNVRQRKVLGYKPPQFVQAKRPGNNGEEPASKKARPASSMAHVQSSRNGAIATELYSAPSSRDFFGAYSLENDRRKRPCSTQHDLSRDLSGSHQLTRRLSDRAAEISRLTAWQDQRVPSRKTRFAICLAGSSAAPVVDSYERPSPLAEKRSASEIFALFSRRADQPSVVSSRPGGSVVGRCSVVEEERSVSCSNRLRRAGATFSPCLDPGQALVKDNTTNGSVAMHHCPEEEDERPKRYSNQKWCAETSQPSPGLDPATTEQEKVANKLNEFVAKEGLGKTEKNCIQTEARPSHRVYLEEEGNPGPDQTRTELAGVPESVGKYHADSEEPAKNCDQTKTRSSHCVDPEEERSSGSERKQSVENRVEKPPNTEGIQSGSQTCSDRDLDSLSLIFSPDSFEENWDSLISGDQGGQPPDDSDATQLACKELPESPVGGETGDLFAEENEQNLECSTSGVTGTETLFQSVLSSGDLFSTRSCARGEKTFTTKATGAEAESALSASLWTEPTNGSPTRETNRDSELVVSCVSDKLSTHPGSLFEYEALSDLRIKRGGREVKPDSSPVNQLTFATDYEAPADSPFPPADAFVRCSPLSEMSPEFYPISTPSAVQTNIHQREVVGPSLTEVAPAQRRRVKSSLGHSWRGSVVSDTVKRECPTLPEVASVRRYQESHAPADQQAPRDPMEWINSVETSESLMFASTEEQLRSGSALTRDNEPAQPRSQRTPFTSAPPEDDRPWRVKPESPVATVPRADQSPQLCFSENPKEPIRVANQPWGTRMSATTSQTRSGCDSTCKPTQDSPPNNTDARHFNSEPYPACEGPTGRVEDRSGGSQFETENCAPLRSHSDGALPTDVVPPEETTAGAGLVEDSEGPAEQARSRTTVGPCRRVGLGRARRGCVGLTPGAALATQAKRPLPGRFQPPVIAEHSARPAQGEPDMAGDLSFPSAPECENVLTPTRQVTIPATFETAAHYKQVFKAALREHLNIVLFELARQYHSALQKVDVSHYSAHHTSTGNDQHPEGPSCTHGTARLRAVKKEGPNKGRLFYSCPGIGQSQCKFFKWADEHQSAKGQAAGGAAEARRASRVSLSTAGDFHAFFKSHNIPFYCECRVVRKLANSFGKYGKNKWSKRAGREAADAKKGLYLELSRKDNSSIYSKDDIWIVSKSLSFDRHSTFVAKSVFYGPSSNGELQIAPISGYSPSNWQSGELVHALLACNAGNELTCIENIDVHVKAQNLPLLPHILYSPTQALEPTTRRGGRAFVPPTLAGSAGGRREIPWGLVESVAEDMISHYRLNQDQAAALRACTRMFGATDAAGPPPSLTLIHGVFGAGKSFLLAVLILFLVEVFRETDAASTQDAAPVSQPQWKILVSSTTNVAVDRILLGLLELGFEEFVRVGSVRKIAKPVLPHSVHSTGSESHELRELQALLKGELTPAERNFVRKSIERHKLGANRKRLAEVRVVGVTCAACVFPCLEKLKFPIVLLDECSQMTEPASLLPVARFDCRKLVLVGDPKQLSPTIQGSEPEHRAGLEQTMFERLMKMGYEPTMLRTQYRCHPSISAIANRLFYEGQLVDGVTEQDRAPLVDVVPTLCFYNITHGREKCGSDGSYYNEAEATFAVFLIERLLESGVTPSQIGVITLYKSQLHTISTHLAAVSSTSHTELKAIQISTVDAFQGGEKDVIILSCVRTDHVGFIDCDRRTNVALTRAKRHLLILGNLRMLSRNAVWGRVIEHCEAGPRGICDAAKFMKTWEEKLSDENKENGVKSSANCSDAAVSRSDAEPRKRGLPRAAEVPSALEPPAKDVATPQLVPEQGNVSDTEERCSNGDDLPTFDLLSSMGI